MKRYFFFLLLISMVSCKETEQKDFSFFIAGHTYGDPLKKGGNNGLYKPFTNKIPLINSQNNMEFGVLLGDVVWKPNKWQQAKADISKFNMPIYVARGNHDGPLDKFEADFGKSYKSFVLNDNLFVILDPNIDKWNISNEQLVFLKNRLRIEGKNVKNIFIFCHQVIWWSKDKSPIPRPNSLQNKAETPNYWSVIEPILRESEKPVYLFAGDVGAFSKERKKKNHIIEYSYQNTDNITYISSGMGGGVRDNFVIVDVSKEGIVSFRLIHLNGNDINSLGKLEDYTISMD